MQVTGKVLACSRYSWNLGQGGSQQKYYWVCPSRSWETGHSGFLKHQSQASLKAGLFNIQELTLKSISTNYITYTWIPLQFQRKGLSSFCCCFLPTASCVRAQSRQTFCDPMDCSLASSSVRGIDQARILEWVGISFSRGSSWSRDQICVSHIGRQILYHWDTWEVKPSLKPLQCLQKEHFQSSNLINARSILSLEWSETSWNIRGMTRSWALWQNTWWWSISSCVPIWSSEWGHIVSHCMGAHCLTLQDSACLGKGSQVAVRMKWSQ